MKPYQSQLFRGIEAPTSSVELLFWIAYWVFMSGVVIVGVVDLLFF